MEPGWDGSVSPRDFCYLWSSFSSVGRGAPETAGFASGSQGKMCSCSIDCLLHSIERCSSIMLPPFRFSCRWIVQFCTIQRQLKRNGGSNLLE
jgi:hypothetical protein